MCKQTEEIFTETLEDGTTEDSWFLCETQNWGECPDDDWNTCIDGYSLINDGDTKQCISCSGDNNPYRYDWSLCCTLRISCIYTSFSFLCLFILDNNLKIIWLAFETQIILDI